MLRKHPWRLSHAPLLRPSPQYLRGLIGRSSEISPTLPRLPSFLSPRAVARLGKPGKAGEVGNSRPPEKTSHVPEGLHDDRGYMDAFSPCPAGPACCRLRGIASLLLRRHFALSVLGWITLALMSGWAGVAARAQEGGERPLPDPVRTNRSLFTIPFRLEEPATADSTPRRVILAVSRDLGATWRDVDDVAPTAQQFTYRATTDGEYWFRLRAEDAQGRQRGGNGPDVRVILNAAGPRLAARAWLGPDGEVVCRFAAFDDTLDIASLRLEYRTTAEPNWQTIEAVGLLSREAPAHLVGEELWWAGDDPQGLTVRLTIQDESGNASTQHVTLQTSDPGVTQHQLAREIGAPPLPGSEPVPEPPAAEDEALAMGAAAPAATSAAKVPTPPWQGVEAGWGSDGNASPRAGSGVASVLTASRPQPVGPKTLETAPSLSIPADVGPAFGLAPAADLRTDAAVAEAATRSTPEGRVYKGKPLMLSSSRRFDWDYGVDAAAAGRPVGTVELWGTQDGGLTWQRVAVDDDRTSPIAVSLEQGGLVGFRLELAAVGEQVQPPRSGDAPQCWVGIDEIAPVVSIHSVVSSSETSPTGEEVIAISYACDDPLIVPTGATLQFSPNPEGPWATVAAGLEASGRYLWSPGRNVPARAYLRIEAADAAGNVGFAVTPEPVSVGGGRPTGQLRMLRPLSTPQAP